MNPEGWMHGWNRRARLLQLAGAAALVALLYLALRNVPVRAVFEALARLHGWQIAALLLLDGLIYCLVTARWWMVVRADQRNLPFWPMFGIRLAAFAVSYFTFGPQIGGEPLQVIYLRQSQGISYTRASASVLMDKLFELLGNFVLLCVGLVAVLHSGLLSSTPGWSVPGAGLFGLIAAWPVLHILLLHAHIYPVSVVLSVLGPRERQRKAVRFVRAAEHLAGQFCQRHPKSMLGGLLISLIAAAATVSEYALVASFLDIHLPFWQLVTAWTSGWLSFLVPLPGGLGALEASQVFVLGLFGVSAATAISLSLVLRGRDLVIGGLGLLLAAQAARNGITAKDKSSNYG